MSKAGAVPARGVLRPALAVLLTLSVAGGGALALWRRLDIRADRQEMARLRSLQPAMPEIFDPAVLADLPEPARRYLTASIRPGTPLRPVAMVTMDGVFRRGDRADPIVFAMRAEQVLAMPHGFVWVAEARRDGLVLSGSDGGGWSRFWMAGLLPVARARRDANLRRSAFGRGAAEAVFWTPAAVMPGSGVTWDATGPDTARVTLTEGELSQSVDLRLDAEGRPVEVSFQRWSDANPEGRFQLQPFGAYLSDFRWVDGYRVPHRVEAGNFFGTPDYFPFFDARVTSIAWPTP